MEPVDAKVIPVNMGSASEGAETSGNLRIRPENPPVLCCFPLGIECGKNCLGECAC
jgi:hypothetical protein